MSKVIEMKEKVVAEITEKFEKSIAAVVVDYRGLKVEEVTELRAKFREAGVEYKVYKNTMMRRAARNAGMEEMVADLVGPNAVAFSYEDPVAPARILNDFAKNHKALELKVGFVEGSFYDEEKLKELASVPSREVLIAKLLSSFNAPMANFACLIKAIADKKTEQEA
ncbi:ribosomal protein L10 [Alkaliphilus metalliredigens QYMF]|uniref:Large ribosomal subunit protein uL10 n=1 Tax=Alkaliphilus metalliredigens (strain QYMF) TaxID=293826 RepID=RL10_ALKMQ|nr:50S ribosomal protein L10 [Alkaliphilus metalliredigens]A6TWJ2.1 RecName: Full=Large ribosomal subunit protein uL10; AltName: Full=50S ribosomal protein L10 [Alkaliphilus metalliredigens QYMF]ABR50560.1 ribosomal protein L10 [Alkaliphilus metalliredigens QYMF]